MIFLPLSLFVCVFHLLFLRGIFDSGTNAILLMANLLFAYNGISVYKKSSLNKLVLYLLGYLLIFIFIFGLAKSPLLFTLFIILYSSLFFAPRFLAYLSILAISIVFFTPYWLQLFILAGLLYAFSFEIYKKTCSKFFTVLFLLGSVILIFILFPVIYFSLQSAPQNIIGVFKNKEFQGALMNSLVTASASTLIILIFGVPLAYVMARVDFKGRRLIDSLIDIPILIPQTVAGVMLLILLGPKSPLGEFIYKNCNLAIAGGYLGIIAAQVFVSSPFLIRSSIDAFQGVDPQLEDLGRTLGSSGFKTFWRVSLPLAAGGIFNGCILAWARALSEVGSLMVVAYRPLTAPVYLYDQFIQWGLGETQPIAILLVIICLWAFVSLRWLRYQMAKQIIRKGTKYAAS